MDSETFRSKLFFEVSENALVHATSKNLALPFLEVKAAHKKLALSFPKAKASYRKLH